MNYLVPQVRSMMDAEQTTRAALSEASKPPPQLELADLTAGAVADLVNVKREQALAAGEETVPYEPIKPYSLLWWIFHNTWSQRKREMLILT